MYIKLNEIAEQLRGRGFEVYTDRQILPGAAQRWWIADSRTDTCTDAMVLADYNGNPEFWVPAFRSNAPGGEMVDALVESRQTVIDRHLLNPRKPS